MKVASKKKSISITLSADILDFLERESGKSKSAFIDNILTEYRKYSLQKELQEDASTDHDDVMSDFSDYLYLVNHE